MSKLPVTAKLERIIAKNKALRADCRLIVACSGGADSLALTQLLFEQSGQKGWQLIICHVQHHLRGAEAEHDAVLTEQFCLERGLRFVRRDVDVISLARKLKLSREDAARKCRYQALWALFDEEDADYLVTAHHLDDQAETVLLHLLRGAGTRGLRGMLPVMGALLRPLLSVSKQDLTAYCTVKGIVWGEDSSNEDTTFLRNRIRKELLPLLKTYNPRVIQALTATAELAAEDEQFLSAEAERILAKHYRVSSAEKRFYTGELEKLPKAMACRVLAKVCRRMLPLQGRQLERKHLLALLNLVRKGRSGSSINLPEGSISYAYGFLQPTVAAPLRNEWSAKAEVGGICELTGNRFLRLWLKSGDKPRGGADLLVYPAALAGSDLVVRTRADGDVFYVDGVGSQKLKKYFSNRKWAQEKREAALLLCAGNQVLWVIGHRTAGWADAEACREWLCAEIIEEEYLDDGRLETSSV